MAAIDTYQWRRSGRAPFPLSRGPFKHPVPLPIVYGPPKTPSGVGSASTLGPVFGPPKRPSGANLVEVGQGFNFGAGVVSTRPNRPVGAWGVEVMPPAPQPKGVLAYLPQPSVGNADNVAMAHALEKFLEGGASLAARSMGDALGAAVSFSEWLGRNARAGAQLSYGSLTAPRDTSGFSLEALVSSFAFMALAGGATMSAEELAAAALMRAIPQVGAAVAAAWLLALLWQQINHAPAPTDVTPTYFDREYGLPSIWVPCQGLPEPQYCSPFPTSFCDDLQRAKYPVNASSYGLQEYPVGGTVYLATSCMSHKYRGPTEGGVPTPGYMFGQPMGIDVQSAGWFGVPYAQAVAVYDGVRLWYPTWSITREHEPVKALPFPAPIPWALLPAIPHGGSYGGSRDGTLAPPLVPPIIATPVPTVPVVPATGSGATAGTGTGVGGSVVVNVPVVTPVGVRVDGYLQALRAARARPAVVARAAHGVFEQKLIASLRGQPARLVGIVTEGWDFVSCLHKAIPRWKDATSREDRVLGRPRKVVRRNLRARGSRSHYIQDQLRDIADNAESIDWQKFGRCFGMNEAQDRVIGFASRKLQPINRALGLPVGLQFVAAHSGAPLMGDTSWIR